MASPLPHTRPYATVTNRGPVVTIDDSGTSRTGILVNVEWHSSSETGEDIVFVLSNEAPAVPGLFYPGRLEPEPEESRVRVPARFLNVDQLAHLDLPDRGLQQQLHDVVRGATGQGIPERGQP